MLSSISLGMEVRMIELHGKNIVNPLLFKKISILILIRGSPGRRRREPEEHYLVWAGWAGGSPIVTLR